MFGLTVDDLEVGDVITQDGLMKCELVGFDGSLASKTGLVELEYDANGETKTAVKTDREIKTYFSKLN